MASDFEYLGLFNNKHEFKELSTGATWRLSSGVDEPDDRVSRLDGDVVIVENRRGERIRYSIREQRSLGTEYR